MRVIGDGGSKMVKKNLQLIVELTDTEVMDTEKHHNIQKHCCGFLFFINQSHNIIQWFALDYKS